MSRLKDNISSDYVRASNRLGGSHGREKIVAYVESYDDIFFWRTVLCRFENEKRCFEVMLPSKKKLARGKKSAMMNLVTRGVGEHMIACVDADYDYLLGNTTMVSREVNGNPYVFHTYVYAIENYQCYAPSLHNVCVAVTLNDHAVFDFRSFMEQFSAAIFPLFVWNIWYYRRNLYGQFTITDFNRIVDPGSFNMQDPGQVISRVKKKVEVRVRQLQQLNPDAKESYLALKDELRGMGVTPQTTYLYIQGHHLFDSLVVPMLKKVCDRLVRERQNDICRHAMHGTQMRNELSGYNHSIGDVGLMLRRNTGFTESEPFRRLLADIQAFLDKGAL